MSASTRLEDLRRRVQQDPSSIAFAQLGEEYRRAGELQEAVDVCRAGLTIHPGYISARVTLGRALLDLHRLDEAQEALERVLKSAPENLAAIRGLAEIHHRRGALVEALVQYRAALALARHDPDLEQTVSDLAARLEPAEPDPDDVIAFSLPVPTLFAGAGVAQPAPFRQPDVSATSTFGDAATDPTRIRSVRIVAALEHWLQAIHASRVERHP